MTILYEKKYFFSVFAYKKKHAPKEETQIVQKINIFYLRPNRSHFEDTSLRCASFCIYCITNTK